MTADANTTPAAFTEALAEHYAILVARGAVRRRAATNAAAEIRIALGSLSGVLQRYGTAWCGELARARGAMARALAAIEAGEAVTDVRDSSPVEWSTQQVLDREA